MLIHPEFDPVALHLGPLAVRWYGLMYLVGFALFWVLGRIRAREAWRGITKENVEDLLFTAFSASFWAVASGTAFFISRASILRIPLPSLKFGRAV